MFSCEDDNAENVPGGGGPRVTRLSGGGVPLHVLSVPREPAHWPESLTEAERSVARHLVLGRSYTAIAHERGVRPDTVATQVSAMLDKLEVESAAQLVALLAGERSR